jgi:glycine cleavage system aminomethyltransferase T
MSEENKKTVFELSPLYPFDPNVGRYHLMMPPYIQPWEYNGWEKESMSWKKSCYIAAQLNPNTCSRIIGPDVIKFLSDCTTNGYKTFNIGRCKHGVMTNEQGRVMSHGLLLRMGEEEVRTYSLSPWLDYAATKKKYDIKIEDLSMEDFNFQCGGPRVLEMLETATGDDLHDIPFMGHRMSSINGKPVIILRMGMAGTLAYEVHGNAADSEELYNVVYEAGKKFGVERLGWLGYSSNHSENGFPQEAYHFKTASIEDKDFVEYLKAMGLTEYDWPLGGEYHGSSGLELNEKRFRNPVELNWQNSISLDHDFPGKAVIEKLMKNPERKTVTLIWNVDDLVDVFKSLFSKDSDPYKFISFPLEDYARTCSCSCLFQDDVFDKNGKLIGVSSGREYTAFTRDMFSVGTIDVECANLGNEVYILWGDPGTRQKKIRATVDVFPLLSKNMVMNNNYDVETIPHINKK